MALRCTADQDTEEMWFSSMPCFIDGRIHSPTAISRRIRRGRSDNHPLQTKPPDFPKKTTNTAADRSSRIESRARTGFPKTRDLPDASIKSTERPLADPELQTSHGGVRKCSSAESHLDLTHPRLVSCSFHTRPHLFRRGQDVCVRVVSQVTQLSFRRAEKCELYLTIVAIYEMG